MSKKWKTPAPLYRDPIFDGSADPTVIYNHIEKEWWIVYTQRRAVVPVVGVASAHGTALGIAASEDNGKTWIYRGRLELNIDRGQNTFWAPEIIYHEPTQTYHMYVTYRKGVPSQWGQSRKCGIAHFTSQNLWDWVFDDFVLSNEKDSTSEGAIDACVHLLPNGKYRMWFRDSLRGYYTYAMDSMDLYKWETPFLAVEDERMEGPNVFRFKGKYWLIGDPVGQRKGLGVYVSEDLENWVKQGYILVENGIRPLDASYGRHADVCAIDDDAYIFYFTQPYKDYSEEAGRSYEKTQDIRAARCVVQVGKLDVIEGKLVCDRNEDFEIFLRT